MPRVAFVTNELSPYRRPVVERLGQVDDVKLRVFLSIPVEPQRDWGTVGSIPGVEIKVSKNLMLHRTRRHPVFGTKRRYPLHIPYGTFADLQRFRPDVVLSSEMGFRSVMAAAYCRWFNVPLVIWTGLTPTFAGESSWFQQRIHGVVASRAQAFLTYSAAAEEYIQPLIPASTPVVRCPQSVDVAYWSQPVAASDLQSLRARCELRERVVLFVGSLIALKGLNYLLDAWQQLPPTIRASVSLVLVGRGDQEVRLKEQAAQLGLENVVFTGAKQADELRVFYAMSDLFVFPSLMDTWGLVVNEAMAQGTPVLCSRYAGAAEMIVPEMNGALFDPTDVQQFGVLLREWIDRAPSTDSQAIREHSAQWNSDATAQAIEQALRTALTTR